ncbi:MAG: hypothetical protein SNJ63_05605 [Sphingomonadaceae bacterium]
MKFHLVELLILIGIAWLVYSVMKGGRWNRETRRWERHSPDNPYVRAGTVIGEDARARAELEDLRRRVATLEKLVTDPGQRLEAEIEKLRTPPAGARDPRPDA